MTTTDAPQVPQELVLIPNPQNLSLLTLSWTAPNNSLPGVPLQYTASITGPSFNATINTSDTSAIFVDNAALDCQPHTFSVFAVNEVGEGPTASIVETIPIGIVY